MFCHCRRLPSGRLCIPEQHTTSMQWPSSRAQRTREISNIPTDYVSLVDCKRRSQSTSGIFDRWLLERGITGMTWRECSNRSDEGSRFSSIESSINVRRNRKHCLSSLSSVLIIKALPVAGRWFVCQCVPKELARYMCLEAPSNIGVNSRFLPASCSLMEEVLRSWWKKPVARTKTSLDTSLNTTSIQNRPTVVQGRVAMIESVVVYSCDKHQTKSNLRDLIAFCRRSPIDKEKYSNGRLHVAYLQPPERWDRQS